MNSDLYFINENYNYRPELFVEQDGVGHLLSQGVILSLDRPLQYKSLEYPSYMKKDFYDLEALIVSSDIADVFQAKDPKGMHLTPIDIEFSDGVSLRYFRLDTFIELDLIDYDNSVIIDGDMEDGFQFETIKFDKFKLEAMNIEELAFFKLKGLETIQYVINRSFKDSLEAINTSAIIVDSNNYVGF